MNELRLEIVFTNPLQIVPALPASGRQSITVSYDAFSITSEGDHIMYTLPVDHQVHMQVKYFDSAGNPAVIDGDVIWESSDEDIATVTADASDSTMCLVRPVSQIGQVQIKAKADADLGSGLRVLITTADIEVVAGEAVVGTISPVGDPEPINGA